MKLKSIITAILVICFVFSCKSFLDKDPYDRPATDVALGDINGIKVALNGMYNQMMEEYYYGKVFIGVSEYMGDDVRQKDNSNTDDVYGDAYRYTKTTESEYIDRLWEYSYDVNFRANNIIYYTSICSDGTTIEKNNCLAQALFVRALCHFDLCRAHGQNYNYTSDASHKGVPIVIKPLEVWDTPTENTVSDVYKQIIIDLKKADTLFVENASFSAFYANKYAVEALLSRVYMYMGDAVVENGKNGWEKSIEYASKMLSIKPTKTKEITKSEFVSTYAKCTDQNSESLFELFMTSGSNFTLGAFFIPGTTTEYADAIPTIDHLMLYSYDDIRTNLFKSITSYDTITKKSITTIYSNKYPNSSIYGMNNIRILRLSEVYLNRAESYANLNKFDQALADLNMVRNNRISNPISITNGDISSLKNEIYKERRRELAFEGHRIWDITRRHQNLVRLDSKYNAPSEIKYPNSQFILPIPFDEVNANPNVTQNPGY